LFYRAYTYFFQSHAEQDGMKSINVKMVIGQVR